MRSDSLLAAVVILIFTMLGLVFGVDLGISYSADYGPRRACEMRRLVTVLDCSKLPKGDHQ